jgi:spoIIIJ-associated protein
MATPEAELVNELLEQISTALALDATVEVRERDGALEGVLHGEALGLFVGRHGQTIDAVQYLAQRAVAMLTGEQRRVVVDAEGYRARRRRVVEGQAADAADEAIGSGRPVALEAMTAGERRLVHEFLRDRADVVTHSEGEEPDRRLVVAPAAQ